MTDLPQPTRGDGTRHKPKRDTLARAWHRSERRANPGEPHGLLAIGVVLGNIGVAGDPEESLGQTYWQFYLHQIMGEEAY